MVGYIVELALKGGENEVYIVKKRLFLQVLAVLLVTGIAGLIAAYSTRNAESSFHATAKVLVDQPQTIGPPSGSSNVVKIQAMMPTYAEIVSSYTNVRQVADRLGAYSADEIQGALT
ncbi:MAG: hypothetical protein C4534_10720, partial [Gaiellales bacterium]